jgi:8-oxo-dGTP pyrophosphatase MutT (NUDIX family)
MSTQSLIQLLRDYKSPYEAEQNFKTRFIELLSHPRAFFRDHPPGHMTASSWIVDATRKFVLLTHHAKLNRWLQPGGHADGEQDLVAVARKEAMEETGLTSLTLLSPEIYDIDIHVIPGRNEFPEHLHYDVRFLFEADKDDRLIISGESHNLAWIPVADIAARSQNNQSMIRMAEKGEKFTLR